jgi:hypothetical protein
MSRLSLWPSGFTNARTVTSRGISCPENRDGVASSSAAANVIPSRSLGILRFFLFTDLCSREPSRGYNGNGQVVRCVQVCWT